jgi:hypothetical protein
MRNLTLIALLASACAMGSSSSPSASGPMKPVTFDSGPQCLSLCTELGLRMSALVVLEGKTACVCAPPGPGAAAGATAAAASVLTDKQKEEKKDTPSPNLMQEQQLQEEQKKPR